MPCYRFIIHGRDPQTPRGMRGFYTTRHAFGADQQQAINKVQAALVEEFTAGASAHIWRSAAPDLEVEEGWKIGLHELWSAPNKGSTFYDERD